MFTAADNLLFMQGEVTQRGGTFNSEDAPLTKGVKFETRLKINNKGGIIQQNKDYLELKNVKEATFFIVSNSSYYFKEYGKQNDLDLQAISSISFVLSPSGASEDSLIIIAL